MKRRLSLWLLLGACIGVLILAVVVFNVNSPKTLMSLDVERAPKSAWSPPITVPPPAPEAIIDASRMRQAAIRKVIKQKLDAIK